jgi:hypothetical protein
MEFSKDYDNKNIGILFVNLFLLLGAVASFIMIIVSLFKSSWGPAFAWTIITIVVVIVFQLFPNPKERHEVKLARRLRGEA